MQGTCCEHFRRPRTHTGKQSGERRVKQRIAINAKVNLARERSYLASQVRFRVQLKLPLNRLSICHQHAIRLKIVCFSLLLFSLKGDLLQTTFNEQIDLLKNGRTLSSLPQLNIPGPPPYPGIPVLQSLVSKIPSAHGSWPCHKTLLIF